MKMKRSTILGVLVLLGMALSPSASILASMYGPEVAVETEWLTYTDPRFGLSIQYPADWHVKARDDSRGVGTTLTFSNVDSQVEQTDQGCSACRPPAEMPVKVEIGVYLVEWTTDVSLEEWAARYDAASATFEPWEISIESVRRLRVSGQDALRKDGVSPLTAFKYVNVPWGKTMWFIWTNSDDVHAAIYDHMVASFEFSEETPQTLQEIYGEGFQPLPLDGISAATSASRRTPGLAKLLAPLSLNSAWWVPVRGTHNVRCDSAFHTNGADHAIDIPLVVGTDVYAAQPVEYAVFLGWDSSGYGNLVKMRYDSSATYVSYYAHLESIDYDNIVFTSPFNGLYRGGHLGTSGNTGQSTGPHLHFHIQDGISQSSSNGVNLTGMVGFYPNANYPTCCNPCGYVSF